jgi:hypothetical protein
MDEVLRQCSVNAVGLIAASIFLICFAAAAIAVTRMLQLYIATNLTITRELAAIQRSMVAPASPGMTQTATFMPPSEPAQSKPQEGEIIAYDEAEMADLETIRILRQQKKAEGGMTDAEWQAEIDRVNAAGFKEPE